MSVGYIKDGKYVIVADLSGGGTDIYVQEKLPTDIKINEHWFKIVDSLNSSDYDFLMDDESNSDEVTVTYTLKHVLVNHDDTTSVADTETKTCCLNDCITPVVKTYDGYSCGEIQEVTITKANQVVEVEYNENSYTVTYILNEGMNSSSNPSEIYYTDNVVLAEATKEGYAFGGWYSDSTFTSKVATLSKITKNITLYAKFVESKELEYGYVYDENNEEVWVETGNSDEKVYVGELIFNITYVLNGGINSENNPTTINIMDKITLSDATKDGYTFEGWYSEAGFATKVTKLENVIANITLYAKFEQAVEPYTGVVTNITPYNNDFSIHVTFEMPLDCMGVTLVQNDEHIPVNEKDGTAKSTYITTETQKITYFWMTAETDKQYYYAIYPRNSAGVYNYDKSQTFTFTTTDISMVTPEIKSITSNSENMTVNVVIPKVIPSDTYPDVKNTYDDSRMISDAYVVVRKDAMPTFNEDGTLKDYTIQDGLFETSENGEMYHYVTSVGNGTLYADGTTIPVVFPMEYFNYHFGITSGTYYAQIVGYHTFDDNSVVFSEIKSITIS